MTDDEEKKKVLFRYHSDILDKIVVEIMWASKINELKGIYKLDSIPFYGPPIATDDEFFAEFDEDEEMLTYRKTLNHAGNSIVLVVITKKGFDKESIRNEFEKLDCTSEGLNDSYFAMEILRETDYSQIKPKLEGYESRGIIEYAEPCLSEKHRKDLGSD